MGKFDHFVEIGVQLYKSGARDFDSWSKLLICEAGPAVKPFLSDIMKCTLMMAGASQNKIFGKKNCWEFKCCRRQKRNRWQSREDWCPVFFETKLDGIHGGNNGGRACWIVLGTHCGSGIQSNYFYKFMVCRSCDFYLATREEEGNDFIPAHKLVKMLFSRNRQALTIS